MGVEADPTQGGGSPADVLMWCHGLGGGQAQNHGGHIASRQNNHVPSRGKTLMGGGAR